jgi:hypothetical protein
MLKEYCWLPNKLETCLIDSSAELNAGNSLIVIRLIIRHLSIQDNEIKQSIFNIFRVSSNLNKIMVILIFNILFNNK